MNCAANTTSPSRAFDQSARSHHGCERVFDLFAQPYAGFCLKSGMHTAIRVVSNGFKAKSGISTSRYGIESFGIAGLRPGRARVLIRTRADAIGVSSFVAEFRNMRDGMGGHALVDGRREPQRMLRGECSELRTKQRTEEFAHAVPERSLLVLPFDDLARLRQIALEQLGLLFSEAFPKHAQIALLVQSP
jgi:hypothetical protein